MRAVYMFNFKCGIAELYFGNRNRRLLGASKQICIAKYTCTQSGKFVIYARRYTYPLQPYYKTSPRAFVHINYKTEGFLSYEFYRFVCRCI